ncbi:hypothetical protein [Paraglaciecola chathamensis]|uniref:hypothetical protein n=1 Tax=Paraglaciecola chathamensis TaxID=368405 RepID=UPI0026FD3F07|nr:hypothetical protein [Paraglaciecola chathamensis]MDO6560390.1 hypothetical protein [Paraglaciecola chathamensis]
MNKNKKRKIYVHIGPPKTGTSAIQKFLTEHSAEMIEYGVFYPTHSIDSNGISSGNLLELFTRDSSGNLNFSDEKFDKLLSRFDCSNCEILLLSSEFFFKNAFKISEKIADASFIAYVRNPVELIESAYNQSVKRHGNTKKLKVVEDLNTHTLTVLERTINKVGRDKFILRAYGEAEFENGNIVDDFLSCIGVSGCKHLVAKNVVNPSYCFEALEFKRWLNQYNMEEVSSLIDETLQVYEGDSNYSLLSESSFLIYREQAVDYLTQYNTRLVVDNLDKLIERISNDQPKVHRSQDDELTSLRDMKKYIRNYSEFLYIRICQLLYKHSHLPAFESVNVSEFIGSYTIDIIGRDIRLSKLLLSRTSIRFKVRYIKELISSRLKGDKHYYRKWAVGNQQVKGANQLKTRLGISDDINNLSLLIELSNFSMLNDNLNFSYFLLNEALAIDSTNEQVISMIFEVESKLKKIPKEKN